MAGAPVREAQGGLKGARRALGTAAIFAVAIVLAMIAVGAHLQLMASRELVERGTRAEASLTEVIGGRRSGSDRYSYVYAVGSARFEQRRRSITYEARERLKAGDRVPVWYDRSDPKRSTTRAELDDLESWANRLFFPIAAIALFAWGVTRIARRLRGSATPPVR